MATNPVKVYEYLAVGRPVVATELPELAGTEGIDVFCSNSTKKFIRHIERAIDLSDQPDRVKVRQDWVKWNDWSKRVDALMPLIGANSFVLAMDTMVVRCAENAGFRIGAVIVCVGFARWHKRVWIYLFDNRYLDV